MSLGSPRVTDCSDEVGQAVRGGLGWAVHKRPRARK